MVLRDYATEPIDLARVLEMLAVHDIVEIDAGDTFAYDEEGNQTRSSRENRAADRLFGMLPPDSGAALRGLWEEFEECETPEARFANAIDRFQPFLQNVATHGGTWRIYRPTREQVLHRMSPVRTILPALWPFVEETIEGFYAGLAED